MSYIWEVIQSSLQNGQNEENIQFTISNGFCNAFEINCKNLDNYSPKDNEIKHIEVNPYIRFSNMFSRVIDSNFKEESGSDISFNYKINEAFHMLAFIDLQKGVHVNVVILQEIIKDFKEGNFGNIVKDAVVLFSEKEQVFIAEMLYKLYMTGQMQKVFLDVCVGILGTVCLYKKNSFQNDFILFIDTERTLGKLKMVEMINELFWDISFGIEIVWESLFGIIGKDETMKIEKFSIF